MAPLPKRRWSTRRQGKKRATHCLGSLNLTYCPNCQKPIPSHIVCPKCGYYKGRQVIKTKEPKKPKK